MSFELIFYKENYTDKLMIKDLEDRCAYSFEIFKNKTSDFKYIILDNDHQVINDDEDDDDNNSPSYGVALKIVDFLVSNDYAIIITSDTDFKYNPYYYYKLRLTQIALLKSL